MPFQIGNERFPVVVSGNDINTATCSDTPTEMSIWEKIKPFFCSANKPEVLALIRQICHPPDGTEWKMVTEKFERLKTLTYSGFKENVQFGRDGENHACILDENGDEMLSVTVDDTGNYTVRCQEYHKISHFTATAAPQTAPDYEAIWSAWENAAPAGEAPGRATAVQRMCDCLNNGGTELNLNYLKLTSLPGYLPPDITELSTVGVSLRYLPVLPAGLRKLVVVNNQLTSLPVLPERLEKLIVDNNRLTSLPVLPERLLEMSADNNRLTSLPVLPERLEKLIVDNNRLTSLPVLPERLLRMACGGNYLTRLPVLPEGLEALLCSDNRLISLPALPGGLEALLCSDNRLVSLPALPGGLQYLIGANNRLTSLPVLPERLDKLIVDNNQLTRLPVLPERLDKLIVDNNQLTSLPVLPGGLLELFVSNNQLTSLPVLPGGLLKLFVSNNQLTSLPVLPGGLQELFVNNNQLTSLPVLPGELQELFVNNNQLTSLPVLPGELQELFVNNNQLTTLPESVAGLLRAAQIDVSGNPLSAHTRQFLETITRDLGYSEPVLSFSVVNSPAYRKARPLHLEVAGWLTPAKEKSDEPVPADRWQSFGQEDNAAAFSAFLNRLKETENFRKDSGFKAQIASWLTQLAEDDVLRVKTFAMATEATSSCEDRVTLALNQMKNVVRLHDAEKGKYDNNLSELVSAGREMFRLEKLELIARDKVRTLRNVDEIEVYLGYQNKLKEQLELSSVTAEMRFFEVSYITESDLQAAEIQVKTDENSEFRKWILQWAPLHSVLKRTNPEHWEKCCEKKRSDYSDTYRMLSGTELKPYGLAGDIDAERTVGVRALKSAERAFLDGLGSLVDEMLGEYLKERWS
ncbi:E3 ubiquitin--protein ligase [Morganella morganii]|nr:E3 ubiquitin--protein ligase [Morganella morganii]